MRDRTAFMAVNGSPFSEIGLSIGTGVVCKLVFMMLFICSLLLYVLKDFITNEVHLAQYALGRLY